MKYLILLIIIFCMACSGPKKLSKDFCNCLNDLGFDKVKSKGDLPLIFSNSSDRDTCVNIMAAGLYNEMKNMSDARRAKYLKQVLISTLKTDCGDVMFKSIPYDDFLNEIDRKLNKKGRERKVDLSDVDICDCVNLKADDSDELHKICSDMQQQWKEKYDNASEEEREKMMNEVKNCR